MTAIVVHKQKRQENGVWVYARREPDGSFIRGTRVRIAPKLLGDNPPESIVLTMTEAKPSMRPRRPREIARSMLRRRDPMNAAARLRELAADAAPDLAARRIRAAQGIEAGEWS